MGNKPQVQKKAETVLPSTETQEHEHEHWHTVLGSVAGDTETLDQLQRTLYKNLSTADKIALRRKNI